MQRQFITPLLLLFINFIVEANAKEIVMQEFEFYSQTSGGVTINCGFEFDGITGDIEDNQVDFVNGSINFSFYPSENLSGVMLKGRLSDLNINSTSKTTKPIKNIWFGDERGNSLTQNFLFSESDDGYVFVMDFFNNAESVKNYSNFLDALLTKGMSIGYLEMGKTIDKVFFFRPLVETNFQIEEYADCTERILTQIGM